MCLPNSHTRSVASNNNIINNNIIMGRRCRRRRREQTAVDCHYDVYADSRSRLDGEQVRLTDTIASVSCACLIT